MRKIISFGLLPAAARRSAGTSHQIFDITDPAALAQNFAKDEGDI